MKELKTPTNWYDETPEEKQEYENFYDWHTKVRLLAGKLCISFDECYNKILDGELKIS